MPEDLAEDEETGDDEQRVVRSIVAGVRALPRVQTRVVAHRCEAGVLNGTM